MSSLESITVSKLLAQIPINDHSAEAIDEFILDYLRSRPNVLNKYIEDRVLYQVFIREEDPYENSTIKYTDMEFVRSFVTQLEAVDWIKKNGPVIIDYEENENRSRPVVIVIIPVTNDSKYESYDFDKPCHLYGIVQKCFLTFAFSKRGYEMCLREHKHTISYDNLCIMDIIPWWLTYYDGDTVIRGCSIDYIHQIHSTFTYVENDTEKKQNNLDRYKLFMENPDNY